MLQIITLKYSRWNSILKESHLWKAGILNWTHLFKIKKLEYFFERNLVYETTVSANQRQALLTPYGIWRTYGIFSFRWELWVPYLLHWKKLYGIFLRKIKGRILKLAIDIDRFLQCVNKTSFRPIFIKIQLLKTPEKGRKQFHLNLVDVIVTSP